MRESPRETTRYWKFLSDQRSHIGDANHLDYLSQGNGSILLTGSEVPLRSLAARSLAYISPPKTGSLAHQILTTKSGSKLLTLRADGSTKQQLTLIMTTLRARPLPGSREGLELSVLDRIGLALLLIWAMSFPLPLELFLLLELEMEMEEEDFRRVGMMRTMTKLCFLAVPANSQANGGQLRASIDGALWCSSLAWLRLLLTRKPEPTKCRRWKTRGGPPFWFRSRPPLPPTLSCLVLSF